MNGVVFRDGRRGEGIILLAGSLYDLMAGPAPGKSPASSRRERGRPSPSRKDLCGACDGDKVVRDKFGREAACVECEGRGWFKVDPMLERQASRWSDPPLSSFTRRALCDRCGGLGVWKQERCGMCDGAGKVSVPIHRDAFGPEASAEELGAWDRAIDRRDKGGSYHDLDVCLAELARRSVHRWRVFHAVHVVGSKSPGLISETEARLLAQAVKDLLDWMPREIRVPHEVVAGARRTSQTPRGNMVPKRVLADRDAAIVDRSASESVQEIAKELGLSERTVQRILDKEAA